MEIQIETIKKGAAYRVPFHKVTDNGLELVRAVPFHFVKGDKSNPNIFRQEGFTSEALLLTLIQHLEDVSEGDMRDGETQDALDYLRSALYELRKRAERRKAAGVLGTNQPTPKKARKAKEQGGMYLGIPEGPIPSEDK